MNEATENDCKNGKYTYYQIRMKTIYTYMK